VIVEQLETTIAKPRLPEQPLLSVAVIVTVGVGNPVSVVGVPDISPDCDPDRENVNPAGKPVTEKV